MRYKLPIAVLVVLSAIFVVYVAIEDAHRDNNVDNMASKSKNNTFKKQPSNKQSETPPNQLRDKTVDVVFHGDELMEELYKEILRDTNKKIERLFSLEQDIAGLLTVKEKAILYKLLNEVRTTTDVHRVKYLIDLITCVAERYTDLIISINSVYDSSGEFKNVIYHLVKRAVNAIEDSELYATGNINVKLQRMRILAWKYSLEEHRVGYSKDIPPMDDEAGLRDYGQLQQIQTSNEVEEFFKKTLLYQAQMPMTHNLTLSNKLIKELLDMKVNVNSKREAIDVYRVKAWAIWEQANCTSLDNEELLPFRGLYYQYTIDFCEQLTRIKLTSAMNEYDKEYFEGLVIKAVNGLSEVRILCESKGINLEKILSRKGSVSSFF